MQSLVLRDDGSAVIPYNFDDFPFHTDIVKLSSLPNHSFTSHWHDDVEFLYVLSGHLQCNINGTLIRLEQGQGLFVNSRGFHNYFSADKTDCVFFATIFHPMLLCSSSLIEHSYVTPFITAKSIPYIILQENIQWENEILLLLRDLYRKNNTVVSPLYLQGVALQLWTLLYDNVFSTQLVPQTGNKKEQKLIVLKSMIAYIKKNYQEKLTLDDIAKYGCMSKSGCLALFKRYQKESPVDFLISYRLKVGAQLLAETNSSITAIAYQVGFSSTSYFSSRFHKQYDCTPLEYRKQHTSSDAAIAEESDYSA